MLSIDTELAWGWVLSGKRPEEYPHWRAYDRVRTVVDRLLGLMDRYEIRATWAVVGHLFLARCEERDGFRHPEIVRPEYGWFEGDWFYADPGTDVESDPKWYGPEIVDRILSARVRHEIGSHTFSHMLLGDPGCSREAAASELDECVRLAAQRGVELRSLVFPQNRVGHLDVLREKGFRAYRSPERPWFAGYPRPLWRVAHKLDAFTPVPPPVVHPRREGGLWEVPASYYYRHRGGWARWQPLVLRRWKLLQGVRGAARRKGLFHVWFHPYDLAEDTEALLGPLERCFREVGRLRDQGRIDNPTLTDLVESMDGAAPPAVPAQA